MTANTHTNRKERLEAQEKRKYLGGMANACGTTNIFPRNKKDDF